MDATAFADNDAAVIEHNAQPVLDLLDFEGLIRQLRSAHKAELDALRAELLGHDRPSTVNGQSLAGTEDKLPAINEQSLAGTDDRLPAINGQVVAVGSEAATTEGDGGQTAPESAAREPNHATTTPGGSISSIPDETDDEEDEEGRMPCLSSFTKHKPLLRKIVDSATFESVFAVIIAINGIAICVEGQCSGLEVGNAEELNDQAGECATIFSVLFNVIDWACGLAFSVEMVALLCAKNGQHLLDPWGILDLAIVISWYVAMLGPEIINLDLGVLRVFRLARLLRLFRLLKNVSFMDALFLMTTAIMGSLQTLAWATILMVMAQAVTAMVLQQVLEQYYLSDETIPLEDRKEVYIYFGTVSRSIFSMFELTFANWPPISRLLTEKVSEWFMIFAIMHKMVMGFAVVGVINGVFMQETFKAASADDRIMVRAKEQQMALHTKKMRNFFQMADTDRSGRLDYENFLKIVSDPQVRLWLASMELNVTDADNLFTMLDDGDGFLTADELVHGCARLKGTARAIDVASQLYLQRRLEDICLIILDCLDTQAAEDLGFSRAQTSEHAKAFQRTHTKASHLFDLTRSGTTALRSTRSKPALSANQPDTSMRLASPTSAWEEPGRKDLAPELGPSPLATSAKSIRTASGSTPNVKGHQISFVSGGIVANDDHDEGDEWSTSPREKKQVIV